MKFPYATNACQGKSFARADSYIIISQTQNDLHWPISIAVIMSPLHGEGRRFEPCIGQYLWLLFCYFAWGNE